MVSLDASYSECEVSDQIPQGRPYTHLYVERAQPTADCARARARLGHYLNESHEGDAVAAALRRETGVDVYSHNLRVYFKDCSLPNFLDSLTHVYRALPLYRQYNRSHQPKLEWLYFVRKVLSEENLGYSIDDKGGIHPAPDQEFVVSAESTIAGISGLRYQTVRTMFEKALHELKQPSGTSTAIRHAFDACENLFKLMFDCSRLGENEIDKHLRPYVFSKVAAADKNAASAMVAGMKSWATASHQFRHAPGTEAHEPASADLAILMISSAAAYIRWLASLDKKATN